MSKYGQLNYFEGHKNTIPVVDAWSFSHSTRLFGSGGVVPSDYQLPTAVMVSTNWEVAEYSDSDGGEVFINLSLPQGTVVLSPREAFLLARILNDVADFVVHGKDEIDGLP